MIMSYDLLQKFYEKENELKLFELEIDGVYYWQLIRFELTKRIRVRLSSAANSQSVSYTKKIISTVIAAIKEKRLLKKVDRHSILLLRPCVAVDKTTNKNMDHQYDFSDAFCTEECENIYALGSYYSFPKTVKYNMSIAESRMILWKIKRILFGRFSKKYVCEPRIIEMLSFIRDEYKTEISVFEIIKIIQYVVKQHIVYMTEWRRVFSAFNPRIVVLYPHYDTNMFAAISAAQEMGISTLEIQHGLTNKYCPYYFLDTSLNNLCLPNYIATFGDFWIQEMRLPESTKLKAVGSCYMEKMLNSLGNDESTINKLLVLINPDSAFELIDFIMENITEIVECGFKIAIKLHPREHDNWKEKYPFLIRKDIEVISDPNISVYSEIAKSSHVIGINTTTLFEAHAFKNKVVMILKKNNYYPMMPLVEAGVATLISNKEELLQSLGKQPTDYEYDKTVFWKPNANKNMSRLINSILESDFDAKLRKGLL